MDHDLYKKTNCRYCDEKLPAPFLEMGAMPLANNLISKDQLNTPQFECPLSLVCCPRCYLIQLSHVVPPEKMFSHYLYVSSTTKTFQDHFAKYAATVRQKLKKKAQPLAVDIGSNDGLLVSCYEKEGMRSLGIDPARNLADEANQKGIRTLNRFFDEACVEEILGKDGKADVVSGNNVFAHIDDIQAVLKNVNRLLDWNGMFVIEFPYLITMLDTLVFDMIYHEHLSYIALHPLVDVLKRFAMEIFDVEEVLSHGGSLRVFIQKKGGPYPVSAKVEDLMALEKKRGCLSPEIYHKFADQVMRVKKNFMDLIQELKLTGRTVSGYGAPAKASTIVNFYGLSSKEIDYIVDDNPLKQGRYIPGAKIPIVSSAHMNQHKTDRMIIFAWNFAKEILGKIGLLRDSNVSFLVPLTGPEGLMVSKNSQAFEV